MELHPRVNSTIAKKLWNVLRVTFFMVRKGLVSKRKLLMDMNLLMKRGRLLRKSVRNFVAHHHRHHSSRHVIRGSYGVQEYEFSCSDSPIPVFFHVSKRNKHHFFPCIDLPQVIEETESYDHDHNKASVTVFVPKTPDYMNDVDEFCSKEKPSSPLLLSPFSVRVSNYSSEGENDVVGNGEINEQVDDRAEEFIAKFYEQLRAQSRMQLLQYTH